MSTDNPQPDVPNLDEDLVAFLDGELDDPASRRLQERLAADEAARQRLRALATSWNLLDHLPRAAMDEAFTRTTVALVVSEVRKDIAGEQASIPARKRRRWVVGAAAGLAAALIGFTAVVLAWPDKNEQLLHDLLVVRNLEQYEVLPEAESIQFLRDLETEELFVADAMVEGNADAQLSVDDDSVVTPAELAARRAYVEELPPERKVQLRKLFERFQALPKDEQNRLRNVDAALRSDPNEPRLRVVLQSYHDWLPTLSPLERAELLELPADKGLAEIRDIKRRELDHLRKFAKSGPGPLTPEIVKAIERWEQERAWNQRDEILAKATPRQRDWFENLPDDRKKRSLVHLTREPGPPRGPKLSQEDWDELLTIIPAIKALFAGQGTPKAKSADDLLSLLTKDAREIVKKELSQAKTVEDQQRLLFRWYFRAQFAQFIAGGGISDEELQRFFNEEVSEEDQKELSQLSPDRFRWEIRMKYFREKELPPSREPWRKGKGDRRRGDGRHDREEGPRHRETIHRDGPPHARENEGENDRPERDRKGER